MTRIFVERGPATPFDGWLEDLEPPAAMAAECRPPLDVIETAEAVEVVADLPGVQADSLRVIFSGDTLIIAGHKHARSCEHRDAAFHLAERTFGRFACALRLSMAIEAGRARASLTSGELHVILPRIEDRRGRQINISIESR